MHAQLTLPSLSARKNIKSMLFTKLGRGGRIFSFSPLSGRCVFARESGAVQARSFHYHSEKRTPWNSPREARKAAFIIFFFHYCQNMLYFTFCSWRNFFSLTFQSLSFCLCPIWMLRCLGFSLCFLFIHIITDSLLYWNQVSVLCRSTQGLSVTKCWYSYCQMNHWQRPGPAFLSRISACTTLILGWKHANGNISWTNMVIILRCFCTQGEKPQWQDHLKN